jgi:zinc transport system ATP-binding protein
MTEPEFIPPAPGPLLQLEDVSFAYDERVVLDRVSLEVHGGEFVALAGANGSGKSTLIKVALGLLRPSWGRVRILGSDPRYLDERWRLGYVPQRPRLENDLPATVEEVVATGRLPVGRWWRRVRPDDREGVDHALRIAGLEDLRRARMSKLSGGQQQRCFIARALASMPQLLILDEPTAGIDAEAQDRFRDTLVHHVRVHQGAVLLVTHDLGPVTDDVDRVITLKQGRVER